jgi:hypothetical protein
MSDELQDEIITFFRGRAADATSKINSTQLAKQLRVKPRLVVRELTRLRNAGKLTWSIVTGWEIAKP